MAVNFKDEVISNDRYEELSLTIPRFFKAFIVMLVDLIKSSSFLQGKREVKRGEEMYLSNLLGMEEEDKREKRKGKKDDE